MNVILSACLALVCNVLGVQILFSQVRCTRCSSRLRRWFRRTRASPDAGALDLLAAAELADLVTLAVRAGATARQALLTHGGSGALSRRVAAFLHLGCSLETALRRGAQEVGESPETEVVETLAFSASMGTPLAPVLERLGLSLRSRALSLVEARVARAPVAMLFPLVLFVLPEILILLVGGAGQELLDLLK